MDGLPLSQEQALGGEDVSGNEEELSKHIEEPTLYSYTHTSPPPEENGV